MDTFRGRFPSREKGIALLAVAAFPIYTWSIFRYLYKVPGWIKMTLDLWDVGSILAYVLVTNLIETIMLFLLLLLLHVTLHVPIVVEEFVSKGSTFVVVTGCFSVVLNYMVSSQQGMYWTALHYLLIALLYGMAAAVSWTLVHRSPRLSAVIASFADRLIVLLYLYMPLSVASILIVVARNIL